jgi:hypothetical protein
VLYSLSMADTGRPTVMTPEIIRKLEQAFAYGATDKEACFYAGIAPSTLYEYCAEHPEFSERKEGLKDQPVLLARQTVVNGLKNDKNLAMQYLKSKRSREFSERTETDITTGGMPIQQGMDVEEIAKGVAAELKRKKT